jgi:hypothetical protein
MDLANYQQLPGAIISSYCAICGQIDTPEHLYECAGFGHSLTLPTPPNPQTFAAVIDGALQNNEHLGPMPSYCWDNPATYQEIFSTGFEPLPDDTAYIEPFAGALVDTQFQHPMEDTLRLRSYEHGQTAPEYIDNVLQSSSLFASNNHPKTHLVLAQSLSEASYIEDSAEFQHSVNDPQWSLESLECFGNASQAPLPFYSTHHENFPFNQSAADTPYIEQSAGFEHPAIDRQHSLEYLDNAPQLSLQLQSNYLENLKNDNLGDVGQSSIVTVPLSPILTAASRSNREESILRKAIYHGGVEWMDVSRNRGGANRGVATLPRGLAPTSRLLRL